MKKVLIRTLPKPYWGETENLYGDISGLRGHVGGLSGDATGIFCPENESCSYFEGNFNNCELSSKDRIAGVNIIDLVGKIIKNWK